MDPSYLSASRAPTIVATVLAVQVLGTIVFASRVVSRLWLQRSYLADDVLLSIAFVLAVGVTATSMLQVHYGSGRHIFALKLEQMQKLQLLSWVQSIFYILVMPFVKLSIAVLYRRVFYSDRLNRTVLTAIMVLTVGTAIAAFFINIFTCIPVSAFWHRMSLHDPRCMDIWGPFLFNGISTIVTDVALICVVMPQVWKLQLARRQRIILIGIVSLGWLSVAAAIARMVRTSHELKHPFDPFWSSYDIQIWMTVELQVSIICTALPSSRPLLARMFPRLLSSSATTGASSGVGGSQKIAIPSYTTSIGGPRSAHDRDEDTDIPLSPVSQPSDGPTAGHTWGAGAHKKSDSNLSGIWRKEEVIVSHT